MSSRTGQRPASVRALFWAFSWLALQGFGGVLAVVQRELVEKKQWLTHAEFVEDWAVAQIMPGANVVNLALIVGTATLAGVARLPRWRACSRCRWGWCWCSP